MNPLGYIGKINRPFLPLQLMRNYCGTITGFQYKYERSPVLFAVLSYIFLWVNFDTGQLRGYFLKII
jgi:hypothetical protein